MIVITKVNMDLQRSAYPVAINAVQGDTNTRCLEISLYSGGTAWPVPEGATVAMRYCKPDKTKGYYDTMPDGSSAWSVDGNVMTILLAPQMLTVAGPVPAQVEMIQGSSLLATFTMLVNVAENPAAGVLVSEDYVNWIQWMEDELETRMKEMLQSDDFTGPPGPPGAPATILSQIREYQSSTDCKTEPTGEWSTTIPDVAQGQYLWARTTVTYNTGDPVVSYSVARFGKDGAGTVTAVCNVEADETGNVPLTPDEIGALSVNGGTVTGPLNIPTPTENAHAVNKEYVDTIKLPATLTASGWIASAESGYIQSIVVEGLTDAKMTKAYPVWPDALADKLALSEETAKVREASRSGSTMTFACWEDKPTLDIPVTVEVTNY